MEYLSNLPPLSQKCKKTQNSLRLNTVVLIKDQKKPRLVWALGKVVRLFKGIDGKVRAVQLKTERGLLVRSINHICLLEDSSSAGKTIINADKVKVPDVYQNSLEPDVAGPSEERSVTTRSGRKVKPKNKMDL